MDDEKINEDIQRALKLVEKLPNEYRIRTYEILLNIFIRDRFPKSVESVGEAHAVQLLKDDSSNFAIPIDVKAFLVQNSLTDDVLWKLFLVEGSEVRPIYTLKTEKKAKAQIHVACLLALENALMGDEFEFSIEEVRKRVQALNLYDPANFMKMFKSSKNKLLFTSLDDEENVPISPAGKTELADIIEALTK